MTILNSTSFVSPEVLEFLKPITYIVAIAGAAIYIVKLILSKLVDRYFKSIDDRNIQLDEFGKQLIEVITEMKLVVRALEDHKEYDEQFRAGIDEKVRKLELSISSDLDALEKRLHEAMAQVKSDFSKLEIVTLERHNEVKGKVSKQWESLGNLKERLEKLISAHEHFHSTHL